jgi:murein DD-endopeptidase MepM/ murein hydrolase activator NlpD
MLAVRVFVAATTLCGPMASAAAGNVPVDPIPAERPTSPRLFGYLLPVASPLLLDPLLLPGSPREYRGGIHEGIDFRAPYGMPVRAAREGIVVRVDSRFVEWSARERAAALARAVREGGTPLDVLDRLRGRQVWIDHGDGVVTRYAHLSRVSDLRVGQRVDAGEVIGAVGASGLPEGGPHLHLEIRVDDGYLGQELSVEEVRDRVVRAFSPAPWRGLRAY